LQLVATFYVGGLAAAIELALELGEDDRAGVERMAGRGARRDAYGWTEQEFATIGEAHAAA